MSPAQRKRRYAAYRSFDAAYKRKAITEHAREFGKRLVRLAGDGTTVRGSQSHLAKLDGHRRETINTWLHTFEAEGLIWTEPDGNRKVIHISVFNPRTKLDPEPEPAAPDELRNNYLSFAMLLLQLAPRTSDATEEPAGTTQTAAFFEPETCDPPITDSVSLRSQSSYSKSQVLTDHHVANPPTPQGGNGGGKQLSRRPERFWGWEEPDTEATRVIVQFAAKYNELPSRSMLNRHTNRSAAEITAMIVHVEKELATGRVYSPVGFLDTLLCGGGPWKLKGKARSMTTHTDPSRYITGELSDIVRWQPDAVETPPARDAPEADTPPEPVPNVCISVDDLPDWLRPAGGVT